MKRFIFKILALTAAMTLAGGIQAIAQDDIVNEILANSPRLKALSAECASQQEALRQSTHFNYQPEVEFERLWSDGTENRWSLGVSQSFDWPGVYKRRRQSAALQTTAYEYLYATEMQNMAVEARLSIAQCVYAAKRLAVLNAIAENITKIKALVNEGYEKGQLTVLDVRKLDFEEYSLNNRIDDARQELELARQQVNALAGKDVKLDLSAYAPQQLMALDYYLEKCVTNNKQIEAEKQNAESARAMARVASAERMPAITLGYKHAYEEHNHFNGISIGVSLPIFTTKAGEKAAQMQAQSLDFKSMQTAADVQGRQRALYTNAVQRNKYLAGIQKVVLDNNYPSLLMMAYKGGQINVISYLQELNYFVEARMDYLSAEYSYIQDLTQLNKYN